MARSTTTAALHHRSEPTCPAGPMLMMGDGHRVGCASGRSCQTAPVRGGAARAEYYARIEHAEKGKKPALRALYLCAGCAKVFAHRFGLEVPRG